MMDRFLVSIALLFISCDLLAANVLIYNDEGVDRGSFERAYSFFEKRGDKVSAINSEMLIRDKNWMIKCDKLVMPGGADCPYHEKLKGAGCSNIREFVRNGGVYIGICAGAYFGCRKVEFALGTDLEVNGDRELAFFPGIARGPMLKPYDYDSEKGASAARIRSLTDGGIFYAYHNGGSTFILEGADLSNITILAEYADAENVPAIIECKYGKGKAVLSGVHYEGEPNLLTLAEKDAKIIKPIAKKIEITAKIREKFLDDILK